MSRLFHLSREMFRIPAVYAVPMLVVLALFALFPQIDLIVSGWFYDPSKGGFWLGHGVWIDRLGDLTSIASAAFVLVCFLLYGFGICRRRVYCGLDRRLILYFGLVLLIGPLLVVTVGFKEFWGRPRPISIVEFGGDKPFEPYYLPSNACDTDCSFPSGHTSRAFYFLALAFAAYRLHPRRAVAHRLLAGAVAFGLVAAFLRIIEGMHFLSDVTVAAFILFYVSWVLRRVIWPEQAARGDTA